MQFLLRNYPALGEPLYRRYWLASLGSVGGWQISAMAMAWLIYELSQSTLDLGILGAATAVPAILLTLVGGVIADRFEKRAVLIWTTVLNTLLLLLLALLAATEVITVWQIWLIAGAISVVSGIDWPTRQSFFPHLIQRESLLSAVALNSVLWQATRMVLPAFGGVLIALIDIGWVFALAGAGYAIMLLVILSIRMKLPGHADQSALQQIAEGVRFILSEPLFRGLILLSYAAMFFLSAYMQLMPAFADLLNVGPEGFGILMSVTGVGSILGTVFAGSLKAGGRYGFYVVGATIVAVIMFSMFAWATTAGSYPLSLTFITLGAMGTSVFLILSTTAMQAKVPDRLRGRVMGIHGITYSLMPLGGLLLGAMASSLGAPVALLVSLGLFLLVLAAVGYTQPQIVRLTQPNV